MDLNRVAWAVDRGTVFGEIATVRSVALDLGADETETATALGVLVAAGRVTETNGCYLPRR